MMLPTDQSQSPRLFDAYLQKVQNWVRQEIVDDDPWDVETLSPTSASSKQESSERRSLVAQENSRRNRC